MNNYPEEILDKYDDDGTIVDNVQTLCVTFRSY